MAFTAKAYSIPKKYPFAFGIIITCGKTCGVDLMVQKFIEKREEIDVKRLCTFGAFGVLYQGVWQYYLFNRIMPVITPGAFKFAEKTIAQKLRDIQGMKNVMIQNLVENGINNTLLFFPCFYTVKEMIQNGASLAQSLSGGIARYRLNFWSDITACWSLWIPAQTINFAFSPAWARVPFVACVSALWTGYVSLTRGAEPVKCDSNMNEEAVTVSNNKNIPVTVVKTIETKSPIQKKKADVEVEIEVDELTSAGVSFWANRMNFSFLPSIVATSASATPAIPNQADRDENIEVSQRR